MRALETTELLVLDRATFDQILVAALGADRIRSRIQIAAFLRRVELFSHLPDQALREAAAAFAVVEVAPGHVFIRAQQPNETFHVVYEGEVEVRCAGETVQRLHAGDFFGEISLLRHTPATADVVAAAPGRCLVLPRHEFLRLISQDVHAGMHIETTAGARVPDPA